MGNAERRRDEQQAMQPSQRRSGLDVPADWYVDPADPNAAESLEHGLSLEDQATAFLAEHERAQNESEAETTAAETADAGVTALSEAPSRRTERESSGDQSRTAEDEQSQAAGSVWLGLPSLVPVEEIEGELAWQVDALCAQTDPEAFFPEKGGSTRDAKKVCAACTVRSECLDYALGNDERFGIWGGLSERERRKLRKRTG